MKRCPAHSESLSILLHTFEEVEEVGEFFWSEGIAILGLTDDFPSFEGGKDGFDGYVGQTRSKE